MFEVYLSKPSKPKLILNSKVPPKLLNKQTTDSCINRRAEPYRSAFAMKPSSSSRQAGLKLIIILLEGGAAR